MSLTAIFKSNGPSGFGYGSTAEQATEGISLAGKNILVTGCSSGLGKETLRVLVKRGARVIGTARTVEKAREACAEAGPNTIGYACELSEPASVRACVEAVKKEGIKLDAIICNAGIMALPKLELKFGYEMQFFTNHMGHFILVTGLMDRLNDNGRVVMLSSDAHRMAPAGGVDLDNLKGEKQYKPWAAYGQSKFANLLFAKELAIRLPKGKTANAVHPGVIQTNLGRHMPLGARLVFGLVGPLFLKSIPQGAATQCYAAVNPAAALNSGKYFADCNVTDPRKDAENMPLAGQLWDASEKIAASLK